MKRQPRLLLIEDDTEVANGMKAILEAEGIKVHWRSSVITLPLEIREIDPDLILLDLNMPALSGTHLLEAGAQRILRSDTPIALFSGRPPQELSQLTEQYGLAGFISKGDELAEVICSIQVMLRNAAVKKGAHHAAIDASPSAA
jgi:DNA-binding response OmpR family regulator